MKSKEYAVVKNILELETHINNLLEKKIPKKYFLIFSKYLTAEHHLETREVIAIQLYQRISLMVKRSMY